ncbi:MAG: acyl--CoA ligase [Frankiaceae bacterium]|nr:acyl--CoA ligase [Frankiaceae bacterium]
MPLPVPADPSVSPTPLPRSASPTRPTSSGWPSAATRGSRRSSTRHLRVPEPPVESVTVIAEPGTFAELWQRATASFPDAPFFVFEDRAGDQHSWTYAAFDKAVERVADTLAAHGVRPGDAVHVVLRNSPAFVAIWLAVSEIGAFMVPVDPASTVPDIDRQVRRVSPRLAVCADERRAVYDEGAQGRVPVVLSVTEGAEDLSAGSPLIAGADRRVTDSPVTADTRLAVMFTSGTTAEPKGVVLTQGNYAYVARSMAALADLEGGHRWLVCLPLFHANAQYYCFAPAISVGASVALTASFSASRWLQQAHDLKVTHASLFAAPIRMILARRPADPPSLRLQHVWFAQNISAAQFDEFSALVGCRPRQLYGMTETLAVVFADTGPAPRHDVIGLPAPGRVIAVQLPEAGAPAPDGSPGMLSLAGRPGVELFQEYLGLPSPFQEDEEGTSWFCTGDLVSREADGRYRFHGRDDDVIKVGGENVSLSEVETVLSGAPGILEVAVVARPDEMLDRVPVAFAVPRDLSQPPAVEALQEWAAANLVPAARPRAYQLLDELPRTSVGKIRRFQLKAAAEAMEATS